MNEQQVVALVVGHDALDQAARCGKSRPACQHSAGRGAWMLPLLGWFGVTDRG